MLLDEEDVVDVCCCCDDVLPDGGRSFDGRPSFLFEEEKDDKVGCWDERSEYVCEVEVGEGVLFRWELEVEISPLATELELEPEVELGWVGLPDEVLAV